MSNAARSALRGFATRLSIISINRLIKLKLCLLLQGIPSKKGCSKYHSKMLRPKSLTLIASEIMSYPSISSIVLFCTIPALAGLYISILFTMRYWIPDNIVVLILGFSPSLVVVFQIYYYLENPLLPTYESKSTPFAKSCTHNVSQIIVGSS